MVCTSMSGSDYFIIFYLWSEIAMAKWLSSCFVFASSWVRRQAVTCFINAFFIRDRHGEVVEHVFCVHEFMGWNPGCDYVSRIQFLRELWGSLLELGSSCPWWYSPQRAGCSVERDQVHVGKAQVQTSQSFNHLLIMFAFSVWASSIHENLINLYRHLQHQADLFYTWEFH